METDPKSSPVGVPAPGDAWRSTSTVADPYRPPGYRSLSGTGSGQAGVSHRRTSIGNGQPALRLPRRHGASSRNVGGVNRVSVRRLVRRRRRPERVGSENAAGSPKGAPRSCAPLRRPRWSTGWGGTCPRPTAWCGGLCVQDGRQGAVMSRMRPTPHGLCLSLALSGPEVGAAQRDGLREKLIKNGPEPAAAKEPEHRAVVTPPVGEVASEPRG